MAEQRNQQDNSGDRETGRQRPAGQQSDPDSIVRKGGIARSEADAADVTRDTHGFPGGEAAADRGREGRRIEATEADEALTEALEEAKAEKEPAQQTGNRGQGPEDSEAAGE